MSHNQENEPVYETYTIKLNDFPEWANYMKQIPALGYVKSKTKVVAVTEVKKGQVTQLPKEVEVYQAELVAAMNPKKDEPTDYKSAFEQEKKRNDDLLKRIEALEGKQAENPELEQLRKDYAEIYGKQADKRWNIDKLKSEIEK